MKAKLKRLSHRYLSALRTHLKQGPTSSLLPAQTFGRRALVLGLEALDMAKIHEQALASLDGSTAPKGMLKRAQIFYAEAITPIEKTHRGAREDTVHLNRLNKTLGKRTMDLAACNRNLKQRIVQRKHTEKALKKSGDHHTRLLEESRRLQKHLRRLTHQMLTAQEDKRTRISRELYDEIAQSLLGINVRLVTLRKEAVVNAKGLQKEIASTQRLVENSMKTINRFAREFGVQHES